MLKNVYSQNGEDGVIEWIFNRVAPTWQTCCEFGAWDGLHFSNTRLLVERGWSALLIEADEQKFARLEKNNAGFPSVHAVRALVTGRSLTQLVRETFPQGLDFLSVDVDGLDFEILRESDLRPKVICVEVNAGHDPKADGELPRKVAAANIGQPFGVFHALLSKRGYKLVEYTGNAFYVEATAPFDALTPVQAYGRFLDRLSPRERAWLFHVNRGDVPPFHHFRNGLLDELPEASKRYRQSLWRLALHRVGRYLSSHGVLDRR